MGSKALADEYAQRAASLGDTVRSLYWDGGRGLFADTPEKKSFSQHQNAFAILTGLVKGDEAKAVAAKLIEDKSLTESTLYFRYYIHTALLRAGLGDRFLDQLGTWRDALKIGLTTWPEMPEPSRSDAHAWSSHPSFDFFRTMLGIEPAAPQFAKIRIAPNLGKLPDLSGTMPHPGGEISVSVKKSGVGVSANVDLPSETTGEFVWAGKSYPLHAGANVINAAGKSTFVRQITGVEMPTRGKIIFDVSGEKRAALTVPDMLDLFKRDQGEELSDDALLLG